MNHWTGILRTLTTSGQPIVVCDASIEEARSLVVAVDAPSGVTGYATISAEIGVGGGSTVRRFVLYVGQRVTLDVASATVAQVRIVASTIAESSKARVVVLASPEPVRVRSRAWHYASLAAGDHGVPDGAVSMRVVTGCSSLGWLVPDGTGTLFAIPCPSAAGSVDDVGGCAIRVPTAETAAVAWLVEV